MKRAEQTPVRRFFTSRVFLIFALIAALATAFGFARAYYQDYKVRQEINELEAEVKKLEKKKLESMEILKYVTSQNFVEDKARTELNLKKPGEHVIFIQNGNSEEELEARNRNESASSAYKAPKESGLSAEEAEALSNPAKWWYYFTLKRTK